jgi:DJ-1/PfpI family
MPSHRRDYPIHGTLHARCSRHSAPRGLTARLCSCFCRTAAAGGRHRSRTRNAHVSSDTTSRVRITAGPTGVRSQQANSRRCCWQQRNRKLGSARAVRGTGYVGQVQCLSQRRSVGPVRCPGNLNLVPHYSFAEYDATFGGAIDLLAVPYIPNASTSDAAVLQWIRAKAESGTTVLSICAGAQVVADAGVVGGHAATTHHDTLPVVERSHPEVQRIQARRWVDSGQSIRPPASPPA